jgi:hypothetical protein
MTPWYRLVIGTLVVWRATHLLQAEDGPWDLVVRLRRAAGQGFFGKLLDCFNCLSVWIALPLAIGLGDGWLDRLLLWPAFSAAAILAERVTLRTAPPASPWYQEDPETDDGMLRKEQSAGEPARGDPS